MNKHRIAIALILIAVFLIGIAGYARFKKKQSHADFRIGVVYFVDHPAIQQGIDGIKSRIIEVEDADSVKIELRMDNAFGEMPNVHKAIQSYENDNLDVILALTTPCAQVAATKVKNTPVVFVGVTDPIGAGLVKSLDMGSGNMTGTTSSVNSTAILELALRAFPKVKTIGILHNPSEANSTAIITRIKANQEKLSRNTVFYYQTVASTSEVFRSATVLADRADALFLINDNTVVAAADVVIKIAKEKSIPIFASDPDSVQKGALFAFALNYRDEGIAAIDQAMMILRDGKSPASIPVYVNAKTYLIANKRLFVEFPEVDKKLFGEAKIVE